MPSMFDLVGDIPQIFGNAPHLCLSIVSRYQLSVFGTRKSTHKLANGRRLHNKRGGGPAPEPPAAPP